MQELEKILEEIDEKMVLLRSEKHSLDYMAGGFDVEGMIKGIIRKQINAGWIPVEEQLPEDGTYLCTLKGELCGIEEPFTGMCGIENGIWDEPDCVIAWRPLPEPYRPERNMK